MNQEEPKFQLKPEGSKKPDSSSLLLKVVKQKTD